MHPIKEFLISLFLWGTIVFLIAFPCWLLYGFFHGVYNLLYLLISKL